MIKNVAMVGAQVVELGHFKKRDQTRRECAAFAFKHVVAEAEQQPPDSPVEGSPHGLSWTPYFMLREVDGEVVVCRLALTLISKDKVPDGAVDLMVTEAARAVANGGDGAPAFAALFYAKNDEQAEVFGAKGVDAVVLAEIRGEANPFFIRRPSEEELAEVKELAGEENAKKGGVVLVQLPEGDPAIAKFAKHAVFRAAN